MWPFAEQTLLALDDCLYALQSTVSSSDPLLTAPVLAASWYQPIAAGRRRQTEPQEVQKLSDRLTSTIDIAEVRTTEGKLHLFVAIDRTSKFAFVRLQESATVETASAFLQQLIDALPYRIHTVLTDNGIQFGDLPSRRNRPTARLRMHMFNRVCAANGTRHRTTRAQSSVDQRAKSSA